MLYPTYFQNIKPVITKIHQWLLPILCVLCGQLTHRQVNLCNPCQKELPILPHHCKQCAQFLPVSAHDLFCGACLKEPPPFDQTYALFPYQSPIIQFIINLKFKHQLHYAQSFAELFLERIKTSWYHKTPLPDLIIPIPLHRIRLRERGFNQALEIAKPIAKNLNIPIDLSIKRIKATLSQSSLSARKRQQNMANAFASDRDYSHLSIAILDDVITTSHTIRACSHLLKKKGAANIQVWCCARRG